MPSPLPSMSYKEFLKNPIIGILFLSLGALTYLYLDNKGNYTEVIEKQENRIGSLEKKIEHLEKQVFIRDSTILHISIRLREITNHDK